VDKELIGRGDEQAQLKAWVTEALAGRGSLVLLGGEAGVGKTILVQHSLATSGLQVLEGFAIEGGTPPFGPVVGALRSYLRAGGVPLLEGPLASHLAVLLLELGTAHAAVDRATLFEAIRLALATIAARRPTAVFLDDLQWADDATLELLGALARSVDCYPLLLLAVFRTDELPRGHPIRKLRSELRRLAGCGS
jgi:predicted ATPase